MSAVSLFEGRFGAAPVGAWSAPGRVNLIGEHTDYTGGLVLPFAIDARARVAIGRARGRAYRLTSAQRGDAVISVAAGDLRPGRRAARGWRAYPLGVVWALKAAGFDVPALDIALDSTVPAGAGLSSSAAVECAVALAVSDHLGLGLDRPAIARIAQRGENDFVAVPCGLMDQMASSAAIAGHALFFDVGADTIEHIPFNPAAAGLAMLVIDTRAHHSLGDGEYAARRADCEEAARVTGVPQLSRLTVGDLPAAAAALASTAGTGGPGQRGSTGSTGGTRAAVLARRVTHVVTENERVRAVVAALRANRYADIGVQLSASHASLRDDFEVSCAELDLAAAVAEQAGALGARMVGGGFGGSVIALAPADRARAIEDYVTAAFAEKRYKAPIVRAVTPADGARRDA